MANIATLSVAITAKTGAFISGTEKVLRRVNRMERQFKNMIGTTGRLAGAFVALAGVGGMGALLKTSLSTVDSLGKTADKLGITTEKLTELRFAAELSGVSVNSFDMAIQRMVRRIAEAGVGTGEAKKAIAELGLNAQRLAQQSPDEQMRVLADAFSTVQTQADKVRLAMKFFDSEGVALVNTLALGRKGLDDVAASVSRLGGAIDRKGARKIESFNDAMSTFRLGVKLASDRIAINLAPTLEKFANVLVGLTKNIDSIMNKMKTFAKIVGQVVLAWVTFTKLVPVIVKGMKAIQVAVVTMQNTTSLGLTAIIRWVGKAIAKISALVAVWWGVNKAVESTADSFGEMIKQAEEAGKEIRGIGNDAESSMKKVKLLSETLGNTFGPGEFDDTPTGTVGKIKFKGQSLEDKLKQIFALEKALGVGAESTLKKGLNLNTGSNSSPFTGAVVAGSQDAIRLAAQNQGMMQTVDKQQLAEQKKTTNILKSIDDGIKIIGLENDSEMVVNF